MNMMTTKREGIKALLVASDALQRKRRNPFQGVFMLKATVRHYGRRICPRGIRIRQLSAIYKLLLVAKCNACRLFSYRREAIVLLHTQ